MPMLGKRGENYGFIVAEKLAVAIFLATLAITLYTGVTSLRETIGLLIIAPTSVLLGYYAIAPRAPDRLYRLSLLAIILAAGAIIAGYTSPRTAAAVILLVLAVSGATASIVGLATSRKKVA